MSAWPPAAGVPVNTPVPKRDPRAPVLVAVGVAGAVGLALWLRGRGRSRSPSQAVAARQLQGAAALLGVAVLADSGIEHYRGCFKNPAMVLPLLASSAVIATSVGGAPGRVGDAAYLAAGTVGALGLGFHLYNIGKRPGGYGWLNLFYAAPFGAPAALTLAAVIGYAGSHVGAGSTKLAGVDAGPALAAASALGLAGTVGEVTLLHFRGAFHNPAMWLPVSLPPVAAALMAKAAVAPGDGGFVVTRSWLWMTAGLGLAGVGFHAYGISRQMGGWRNWSQNVLDGPPLPAPPSFSALALAGLAALDLIEAERA